MYEVHVRLQMSNTASGKLRGNQLTTGICNDMTDSWRTHQIPTPHTNLSHTKATTALQLKPHRSFYFGFTYHSLFGFLVHRTPRKTPHLPVTHAADDRSNSTKLLRSVNCLRVSFGTTVCHNSTGPLHNPLIWTSWHKQPWFCTFTALTCKPGGQQSSTLEIKFADAYLVTWPNTRMDIVHPRSRQSPPAPYTTPPYLSTEKRSTECAYRRRGHISKGIRRSHSLCLSHSLKYKLRTQDPSFIRQLRLSLPVATLRMCGRSPE